MLSGGTLRQRMRHWNWLRLQDGVEFTLLNDHKPLEVIYSTYYRNSARIQRWFQRLQLYRFKVQYVPGKQNIADPLSRLGKEKGVCMNEDAE